MTECLGGNVCTNPRCPTHGIEWTFDGAPERLETPAWSGTWSDGSPVDPAELDAQVDHETPR
jgi:hypothetical protein